VCNTVSFVFFLRLLIIDFVSNGHELSHNEINGGIFTSHFLAYFDFKNAKNKCFTSLYFVINIYNSILIFRI